MDPDDLSGSVIAGRYAIRREIGRGGTATLYLATDLRYDREVAVKVLRQELTGSIAAQRFTTEINTAARLAHPLIVALHDSGEWEGRVFFVMQYVEGDSLRHLLDREGSLPIGDAVAIAEEVAEALEFAHRRGIVHRDIKPANILLHAGHAVVADFGIALALDRAGEGRLTAGFALGTPPYMSPEQTYGDRELDARSDVYSLGCVLYEMLVGGPPFRERGVQAVMARHRDTPPPPLRALRPEVPEALEAVVNRALAKEPDQRFASAREMGEALTRVRTTPPPSERASATSRGRLRRMAIAGAVGALAVLSVPFLFREQLVGRVQAVAGWLRGGDEKPLDRQLVAVAPFYVPSGAPELERWQDGLARVLVASLDGSGALNVRPLAASRRDAPPVTDRGAAAAAARRAGAGFVIFGTILDHGPRAVRVNAYLVDAATARLVDEVGMAASDPAASPSQILSRLADSLSTTLLVRLGRVTRVAAVRRAGVGCPTSSESAKHRYLQAEQFFRQSVWDSAFVAYRDVVASDTSCALAYHRLADVAAWAGSADDSVAQAYQLKAGAHNQGLPLRDSLLITVDSLDVALRAFYDERVPGTVYWRTVARMLATLDEAKRRYPEDPEVWYAAGDASYHWAWGNASVTPAEILGAFDRAIRIDPGFVLSYLHAIELAFAFGDTARATRYVREYTAHRPAGTVDWVGFTMRLIDPRTAYAPETARDLATQSMEDLLGARLIVDRWPDSLESAVRISWQMDTRETRDSARVAECAGGHDAKWTLAQRLAFRGHLRAAACALGRDLPDGGSLVTDLALLGGIPAGTAEQVFDGWLARGSGSLVHALPWWSGRGDTVRLAAAARLADSIARRTPNAAARGEATYTGASARAHLALARRDTADALQRFRSLPDTLCIECFLFDRWTTARVLAARDSLEAASAILSQWIGEDAMAREVPMALDRARVAERRGERERAIEGYEWVVAAWRRGDDVLQPLVAEARAALARLGARAPRSADPS